MNALQKLEKDIKRLKKKQKEMTTHIDFLLSAMQQAPTPEPTVTPLPEPTATPTPSKKRRRTAMPIVLDTRQTAERNRILKAFARLDTTKMMNKTAMKKSATAAVLGLPPEYAAAYNKAPRHGYDDSRYPKFFHRKDVHNIHYTLRKLGLMSPAKEQPCELYALYYDIVNNRTKL